MPDRGAITTERRPPPRPHRAARRRTSRRRRLLTRGAPVIVLAGAAFAAGAVIATGPGRSERRTVTRYVRAWTRGDTAAMYRLLDAKSRARVSEAAFAAQLRQAATTGTLRSLSLVRVARVSGSSAEVTMLADTRVWGTLRETLRLPISGSGSSARIVDAGSIVFPGLRTGETLERHTTLPTRGTLLAVNRAPLAEGPDRTSEMPDVAGQVVGTLAAIPSDERDRYAALGYPADAKVGVDGLEHVFQNRLVGTVGGTLLAGGRTLATARAVGAPPVRTTIDPTTERAAADALGGRYAGILVMNPRTGGIRAFAGIAWSAGQPPGSTMKIITSSAALEAHLTTLATSYPYATQTVLDGYALQNDGGEDCGGTLVNAFAVSCNSVFAPLGVKLGGRRLVAMAEKFGFNSPPTIPGAAEPTIPSAATIGNDVSVGSSAIGQGKVLSTPLEQTDTAATIAMGGRRPVPTLLAGGTPRFVRVIPAAIAREVQTMMIAVVNQSDGTGTAAQIPGVTVAGKTGTAELKDTGTAGPDANNPNANNPKNTDAWFVGYAPVGKPVVAAGALFPNAGAGGATAAGPVREALEAALGEH